MLTTVKTKAKVKTKASATTSSAAVAAGSSAAVTANGLHPAHCSTLPALATRKVINGKLTQTATVPPIVAPKANGLCNAVWQLTYSLVNNGVYPTVKQVAAAAAAAKGAPLNANNIRIEYYRCRAFNGLRGRALTIAGV